MIWILILVVVVSTTIFLYEKYEPFLDVIEGGSKRYLVIWYRTDTNRTGRDYKKLFRVGRD